MIRRKFLALLGIAPVAVKAAFQVEDVVVVNNCVFPDIVKPGTIRVNSGAMPVVYLPPSRAGDAYTIENVGNETLMVFGRAKIASISPHRSGYFIHFDKGWARCESAS